MGKSGSLGANPADAFRKKMQEREAKRNKEVREKMREASWVSKDTAKMERKIEQYRKIVRVRKMTDAEKEKLQSMEAELKDVREKQKAAGITFKKREAADQTAGYDPLAAAEMRDPGYARAGTSALLEEDEYSDSDDNDVIDTAMLGQIVSLDQEEWNGSSIASVASKPHIAPGSCTDTNKGTSLLTGADSLPPMPLGTPPLSPEDLGFDKGWPPIPSGPSPLYQQHNPRPSRQIGTHSQNHGPRPLSGDSFRPHHSFANSQRQERRPHPYAHRSADGRGPGLARPPRPSIPQGVSLSQPPPIPPGFSHPSGGPPMFAGVPRPPARPLRPASATVLAAEPQVRNLKKELTNLVPAALARKSKNKERQQVLAAVPLVPRMVVNAAPDIDAGPGSSPGLSIGPSTGILGAMRPVSGVRFSAHAVAPPESSQATLNAKPSQQGAKSRKDPSLDDEYQRFIKQMDGLL
ncbi:hypothetical protein H4R26_000904 [Coemansia thaxteri]|uniref:Wbp11/ELF5/Saf1 N-terminal domain-containing protein n=1 Tax=Coemansia thaxteri TaxID=2663907 RepID=A0A9W8BMX8_9FUNG|nr:hypothetical protein H4R26_000904 [Coemansia thaxteri]